MGEMRDTVRFYHDQRRLLEVTRHWIEDLKDQDPSDPAKVQFIREREQHLARMEELLEAWRRRHRIP